jgi:hypothetical protein
LHQLGTADIRERLITASHRAGLRSEVAWVDRTLALASGARQPAGRDDSRLAHLVRMFRVLNTCGVAGNVSPDQAHDPANKDQALKDRYTRLRAAER